MYKIWALYMKISSLLSGYFVFLHMDDRYQLLIFKISNKHFNIHLK